MCSPAALSLPACLPSCPPSRLTLRAPVCPRCAAGIGFVNYVTGEAARLAQESMNGVSMGDRLLHVMVQNPASRTRPAPAAGAPAGALPPASLPSLANSAPGGLSPARQAPMSAMHAAAANLGFNTSALASLQAGLMPSATNGMPLPHMPNGLPLSMAHTGYPGMAGQPAGASFGTLQW